MQDRRALPRVRQRMKRGALDSTSEQRRRCANTRHVTERLMNMPRHRQRRVADDVDAVDAVAVGRIAVAVHVRGDRVAPIVARMRTILRARMRSSRSVVHMLTAYRRLASLDRARRRLLIEAVASLTVVWVGLRLLPFLKLQRLLDRWVALPIVRQPVRATPELVKSVNWALTAASARFSAASCLVQALAAAAMLRRRGLACRLRIGVRTRGNVVGARIEAHAWLECDGCIAIGDVAHLSELAVMPSPGAP